MAWTKAKFITILKKLLLEESGNVSWNNDDLLTYLNLSIIETLIDTECKTDVAIIEIIANKNIYNLPVDLLKPKYFLFNGVEIREDTVNETLKDDYSGSVSANVSKYSILDHNRIQLKPRPSTIGGRINENSEYGVIAQSTDADKTISENSEYGLIAQTTFSNSTDYYEEDTPYGVIVSETKTEDNLVVFGVFEIPELINDTDEADLPNWSNLGVCYKTLELLYSELGDKLSENRRRNWEGKYTAHLLRSRRIKGLYTPKSRQGLQMFGYRQNRRKR